MGVRRRIAGKNNSINNKNKTVSLIEMEIAIAKLFDYRKCIIVPNISYGFDIHECDMFIVNSNNYATEVEIKRSIADLKNDKKKQHDHSDVRIKDLYFAIPIELYTEAKEIIPPHAGIITIYKSKYGKIFKANVERNPISNKGSRKLTIEETLKIARLGTLRIWKLKKNIVSLKNNKQ